MKTRGRLIRALALGLAVASPAAAAPEPRRVLLLQSYEREFAPLDVFAAIFREELRQQLPEPVDFVEVSLQPGHLSETPEEGPIVDYLRSTIAGQHLALVVSVGGPAARFAQKYRQQLFPATPLLLAAVDQRFVEGAALPARDAAVAVVNDPPQIIDSIQRLLPRTSTIFVVIGASGLEQFWRAELARAFEPFRDRLTFVWSDGMSFDQILEQSAALPPDSAIFYVLLSLDANGMTTTEDRALAALHAAAKAPVFGLHSTQLGKGVVGGPVMSIENLGRTTAGVAVRMVHGESGAAIRTAPQRPGPPTFDWRELRRFGIPEKRLPPASLVLFREPSAWERYRWQIALAGSVGLAEGMLVVALLAGSFKRRRAERLLRESEERFRLLSNAAPVMIWASDSAGGRTDVNQPWLEFTGRTLEMERGHGWTAGVHADDLERCLHIGERAFDERRPFRREYRLRRRDGEYRWILDTGVPRLGPDGALIGYIGSSIDVTEHRLVRAALSGLSRRLMDIQERERTWIARELHDDLGQRMVGLTMQLHGLHQQLLQDGSHDRARARFGDLCAEFSLLARDLHAVSHRLHSSKLEHVGLVQAVAGFCREVGEQLGAEVVFSHESVPDNLPKDVSLSLFRVLQEAVTNAVRHSGVPRISVTLRGGSNEVQLVVADCGVGFDFEAAMRTGGLGLISMRERVSVVGGELFIESRSTAGTRVRARVPLTPAPQLASAGSESG